MDVETSQAIETLGSSIDRLDAGTRAGFARIDAELESVRGDIADLRKGLDSGIADLRKGLDSGIADLRNELDSSVTNLRNAIDSNWVRTQMLFETLRDDVQMLAGHVADLASRKPRR
jgi:hypothetical protein